jgi:hypothetical protein
MKNMITLAERLTANSKTGSSPAHCPELGPCLVWQGKLHAEGYGRLCHEGVQEYAHRAAFRAFRGRIPTGKIIMHKCDRRDCIEPSHLTPGTKQLNNLDRSLKGRSAGKLTHLQVVEIRRRRAAGEKQVDLAREFGVCHSSVSQVVTGKSFSYLPGLFN